MTIVEAFRTVLPQGGELRRLGWEADRVIMVKSEQDVCIDKWSVWYAPTTEDLIAEDWITVGE